MKKFRKEIKKACVAVSVMLATVAIIVMPVPAYAGLQLDSILNGGTNVVISATTNTYRGSNTVFDLTKSTDITISPEFTSTNANALAATATCTFTFDAAVNGTSSDVWLTNALILTVTAKGPANAIACGITNLPVGQRWPAIRIGEVWNTNSATTNYTGIRVRVFTKTGL